MIPAQHEAPHAVIFDDDYWRAERVRQLLMIWSEDPLYVRIACRWIDVFKWIYSNNCLLIVRPDALKRTSPTLIPDVRWYDKSKFKPPRKIFKLKYDSESDIIALAALIKHYEAKLKVVIPLFSYGPVR